MQVNKQAKIKEEISLHLELINYIWRQIKDEAEARTQFRQTCLLKQSLIDLVENGGRWTKLWR